MLRKGRGKKTFNQERVLFSNNRKDRTDVEKLQYKIISMGTKDLQSIIDNSLDIDNLTLSFAKEELDRRHFNKIHKIDTQKNRSKLNKKYPEHKHILKRWKNKKH